MKKKKRNEHGHIAKRGENKYLVRWREDGKQVSKVVVGDYGHALSFLAQQLNPKHPEPARAEERTFASYAADEWEKYTTDKWKLSTQTTQGSLVKSHIEPYFGHLMLSAIRPVNIVAFHAAMEAKGLGKRTRRNLHSILTRMFSYALELELIEKTPIKRGIAPKLEHKEKPPLNEEQLFALLDAMPICTERFT